MMLNFDQILYNEAIYNLEQQWQRRLTEHEKNIVIQTYRWTRTNIEAEELKILEAVK
jgi:hypothetical protein